MNRGAAGYIERTDIEKSADIAVNYFARQARFAAKPGKRAGIVGPVNADRLKRNAAVELCIPRAVDFAHTSGADEFLHAIPLRHDLAIEKDATRIVAANACPRTLESVGWLLVGVREQA
jgi:hypothetical protein